MTSSTLLANHTSERSNIFWFLLVFLTLGCAAPLLLVSSVPISSSSHIWLLSLGFIVWSALRLSLMVLSGMPRLFSLFWWEFIYIFMGIAPTVQIRSGEFPSTTPSIYPESVAPAVYIVLAAIILWEMGALAANFDRFSASRDFDVNFARVRLVALAAFLVGLYFLASIGLSAVGADRDSYGAARASAWPDLSISATVFAIAVYVSLLTAHCFASRSRTTGRQPFDRWKAAALVILPLIIANPVGNARYVAGTVLLSSLILVGLFATQFRTRVAIFGSMFGFLFVFPVADAFRRQGFAVQRSSFFGDYARSGDYDAFAQLCNTVSFVQADGITWGNQLLGSLLFWVPRSFWRGKPVDTGVLLADFRGYQFTNLSSPLIGEFWINFGFLGLAIGMFSLGFWLTRFDKEIATALLTNGSTFWTAVGAILPIYMIIVLRGSLLQATGGLAVVVFVLIFVRHRSSADAR